jgi:uncharacterized protein YecT (DUF1311 family)
MRRYLICFLLCLPGAAGAQDCAAAMDQATLNQCAYQDWQAADADLNAAYRQALALLQAWDADLPDDLRGGATALKEAQRAWITFRDKACEAEGFAMRGGSAEPLLIYGCMRQVTEDRARQLWAMVDAYRDL